VPANPTALFSSEKSVKKYLEDNLEEIKNLNLKNMKVKNLLNEAEVKEVEAITDGEVVDETPVTDTSKEEIQKATETIDTPVAEEAKEEIVDEISNEAEGTETIPAPAEEAKGLNVDVVAELTSLKALVESVKMENEALKKKIDETPINKGFKYVENSNVTPITTPTQKSFKEKIINNEL